MTKRPGPLLLFAVISGVAVLNTAAAQAQSQDGVPTVSVSCEINADEVEFTITFENPAATDTSVYLGLIVANGKKYLPNELSAEARDATGTGRYTYSDPSVPGIAGRVDPWIMPLPSNSSFSMVRPLGHFLAGGSQLSERQEPFEFRVRFDARSVPEEFLIPGFRSFVGELRSDWIEISSDCTAA